METQQQERAAELVPLGEAARRGGLSRQTLADRVDRGEVAAFRTARDRRLVLVRLADVLALGDPEPIGETAGT